MMYFCKICKNELGSYNGGSVTFSCSKCTITHNYAGESKDFSKYTVHLKSDSIYSEEIMIDDYTITNFKFVNYTIIYQFPFDDPKIPFYEKKILKIDGNPFDFDDYEGCRNRISFVLALS